MAQNARFTQDGIVYEEMGDGSVRVVGYADQPPQPQGIILKPGNPYAEPKMAADTERAKADAARATATAPYDARTAAAQAAKAEADAVKAQRDLQAQQATASPQQQRAMVDLASDEVLAAIAKAREDANRGMSTGYWARLGNIPGIGGLIEPQNAVDLEGSLNTIASRLTLDKLAQLKQASPTGASGLGSLTEREGALLRDSVAALGQTQSQERLLANLAEVEKHYRNVLALSKGEDYRDPKVAEKYGIVAMPKSVDGRTGGDDSRINPTLAPGDAQYREEPDPALRGVNARVRAMVGAGRSADEITAYLNKISPGLGDRNAPDARAAVAFRAQNPRVPLDRYVISLENRQVPMSNVRQTLNSVAQSPAGAAIIGAGDAVTAFNLPNFTGNPELARAGMNQIARDNPVSSLAGTLAGGALAGAGIEAALPARALGTGAGMFAPRLLASDAIYGGAAGYGNGDGSVGSVLKGSLEGMLGGSIGRGAMRAGGNALTGVTNPDVQMLRQRGVPLTVGQMAGGRLARREDRLAGFGGVGDRINDLRLEGLRGFNREAFREGLEPIGTTGVANIAEQGIDEARQAVSDGYGRALNGVRIQPDPQFVTEGAAALNRGGGVARTGPEFRSFMDERVGPLFGQTGELSGPQLQDALQGLRQADFGTDSMGNLASNAVSDFEGALTGLVSRQAPEVMPALNAANSAYRNTSILADAVGRGMNTEGVFTPAQLGMASRVNATKYTGKMNASSTNRPFFDLQRAAQNVLPSKVPDSGTAGRIEAGRGVIGGIRSGIRNVVNAPLYAEGPQPIIAQMLLDRPDALRALGDQINRRARIGGMFGAPLLVQQGIVQGGY